MRLRRHLQKPPGKLRRFFKKRDATWALKAAAPMLNIAIFSIVKENTRFREPLHPKYNP